jgi:hypothetical protein
MERLRQATDRFTEARQRIDALGEMDQKQRDDMAAALRAAEREIEEVNLEISTFLSSSPGAKST